MTPKFQTPWERTREARLGAAPLLGCADELFSSAEMIPWHAEWQDMPEYNVQDLAPQFQVIINFTCAADVEEFGKLIGQNVKANGGKQLKSFWYPEQEIGRMTNKRYIEEKQ